MDVHDRGGVGGPGFIEHVKSAAEKTVSTIKDAFSNIKLPDTAKVKQEMENVQIISKQISGKITLKLLGMISLPGTSREMILNKLEKMHKNKEISEVKLYNKLSDAEEVEYKAQEHMEKFGRTLESLGKFLGNKRLEDFGDKMEQEALRSGLKSIVQKREINKEIRKLGE